MLDDQIALRHDAPDVFIVRRAVSGGRALIEKLTGPQQIALFIKQSGLPGGVQQK